MKKHDESLWQNYSETVKAAARLARKLHEGQTDKAGIDYFEGHLTAVANCGVNWMEQVVGYLHDAAEDTPFTVDEIINALKAVCKGPTDEEWGRIAQALDLLNSHTVANRDDYICRFRGNNLAIRVKLNDLRHNMNISRIVNPTDKDLARVVRYRKEYDILMEMLNECM